MKYEFDLDLTEKQENELINLLNDFIKKDKIEKLHTTFCSLDVYPAPPTNKELMDKINEIIDYINKEEE